MSEKVQYIISEIEKIKAILIANNQLSNIEIDLVKSKLRKAYDLALNLNASSFEVQNADEELNKLIDDHENAIEVIIQKVETVAEDVKHEVIQESRIEVPEPIIDIQEEKVVPIIEQIVQKEPIKESQDKEILADRFHGKQKSLNDIISKYQTQLYQEPSEFLYFHICLKHFFGYTLKPSIELHLASLKFEKLNHREHSL